MITKSLQRALAFAVLAVSASYASSASAQGYLYGGGTLGWPNGFYQDEHIPYFSLHPPVYYSRPVARTYGWSPWAYPPGVLTPAVTCEPAIIDNPHVEESSQPSRGVFRSNDADQQASRPAPRTVHNPYVEPQVASGQ